MTRRMTWMKNSWMTRKLASEESVEFYKELLTY